MATSDPYEVISNELVDYPEKMKTLKLEDVHFTEVLSFWKTKTWDYPHLYNEEKEEANQCFSEEDDVDDDDVGVDNKDCILSSLSKLVETMIITY